MQEENFSSGHSKNSSNLVHLSFCLSWFNRHCWSSLLQARKVKMQKSRWQKPPKNGWILNNIQHPLRAGGLGITIKFIPFKAETDLPAKTMCLKRASFSPPSPQLELVYSTGNIFKNTAKQPTTTYVTKWHNNLCEASQNCGLRYILHFSPTKARHNPEVVKMPVNKMVLTRRHPSGGSLLHHGQQQIREYRISAISQISAIQWFYKEKD